MLALIVPGQDLPWYPTLRELPGTVMTIASPFGSRTSEWQVPRALAGAPARVGAGARVFGAVRRGAGVVPPAGRVGRGLLGLARGRLAGSVRPGLGLALGGSGGRGAAFRIVGLLGGRRRPVSSGAGPPPRLG
ncbi:hypothetical protein Z951_10670 [Streptomyces sp. PRh5]|nr:hypothetical protein Z951_10670 [Streptomyces sp. PRh5]